jgi:hypothetical protein
MRKENKEKTESKPMATVTTYCGFKVIEALHLGAERGRCDVEVYYEVRRSFLVRRPL